MSQYLVQVGLTDKDKLQAQELKSPETGVSGEIWCGYAPFTAVLSIPPSSES